MPVKVVKRDYHVPSVKFPAQDEIPINFLSILFHYKIKIIKENLGSREIKDTTHNF